MAKHYLKEMEELANVLKDWQGLEDQTIKYSEDLMKKSDNPFVKVIMEIIKRDSEKHKAMQQYAIDHLIKEATRLTPQDLAPLSEVLDKHIEAEAKSMEKASAALVKSKDFFTNFIISALLSDEVKHHEMLTKLEQIKGAVYPYGIVRATRPE